MLRVIWTLVKMKVLAQREAYSFGRQVTLSGHYTQVPQRKAMMSVMAILRQLLVHNRKHPRRIRRSHLMEKPSHESFWEDTASGCGKSHDSYQGMPFRHTASVVLSIAPSGAAPLKFGLFQQPVSAVPPRAK
jgi:hypothetical protein